MQLYIRATGNISPQPTFGHPGLWEQPLAHTGNRLNCVEPDYKTLIDPKLIRRMSRIIKMGVAAAMECLQEAGVTVPDAIVTGTAYGCLEDTGTFLTKMIDQQESLLAPTAFIQSTHNTVGAQIALQLKCHGYNNVFVHRSFSFESALLDAMLLLQEGEANNVLVGGLDEITNASHTILSRFGIYKKELRSNLDLYDAAGKGTIAGEGAAFFLLTRQASGNDYAKLAALTTFYKPSGMEEISGRIGGFLQDQSITTADIDLLITGRNGDIKSDDSYDKIITTCFTGIPAINYKHLCGEYPTSAAFALWLASQLVMAGQLPADGNTFKEINSARPLKRILIYHQTQYTHHSLLLITAC